MNELSSALRTQSGSGRVDELTQGRAAYVRLTVYLGLAFWAQEDQEGPKVACGKRAVKPIFACQPIFIL